MTATKPTITIILPTYNELGNIIKLIRSIKKHTGTLSTPINLLIIDDDSPDGTGKITQKEFRNDTNVKVIIRTNEKGLASAVLHGINQAKTGYVLLMDTDFNHHPKYIPQMIRHLQQHPETVISGSRYIKGGGMDKREQFFGSHLINFAGGIILGCPIHDFTGGYILLSKKTLDKLPLDWIFRGYGEWGIRLHYSLYRSGIKTKEIPVFYPLRKSGNSKTKPLSYAFVLLRAFIETRLYFK